MTPRQEEARRLALSGLLNTEIAAQMGISHQRVHNLLKATGTPSNSHPKPNKDERIARLYQLGMSITAIAKVVKISNKSVRDALKRKGVETRKPGTQTLLSGDEIRALALSGLTVRQIAEVMKCSRQTVYNHFNDNQPPPSVPLKPTAERIVELYQSGLIIRDVASLLKIGNQTVMDVLNRAGIPRRRPSPKPKAKQ